MRNRDFLTPSGILIPLFIFIYFYFELCVTSWLNLYSDYGNKIFLTITFHSGLKKMSFLIDMINI